MKHCIPMTNSSAVSNRRTIVKAAAALPFVLAQGVQAQPSYPDRAIRVIVPYAPGGALDTLARTVSLGAGTILGQSLVIENKPGGFNILGNDTVAKAHPDGYTILFAAAPIAYNTALGLKLPYDPMKDFEYVSLVARIPGLFIVHPSLPVRTLKELVAYGKAQPEGLQFATAGVGSMPHLLGEYFFRKEGVKAQHIGYKGSSPALQALIGGQVKVLIDAYIPSGPQIVAGHARAIAVASAHRSPVLPDVPTVAENGFPGFEGYGFYGVLTPARTPKAIVDKLHAAYVSAVGERTILASLISSGYEVIGSSPAQYRAFVQEQIAKWTPVVKEAQIHIG